MLADLWTMTVNFKKNGKEFDIESHADIPAEIHKEIGESFNISGSEVSAETYMYDDDVEDVLKSLAKIGEKYGLSVEGSATDEDDPDERTIECDGSSLSYSDRDQAAIEYADSEVPIAELEKRGYIVTKAA